MDIVLILTGSNLDGKLYEQLERNGFSKKSFLHLENVALEPILAFIEVGNFEEKWLKKAIKTVSKQWESEIKIREKANKIVKEKMDRLIMYMKEHVEIYLLETNNESENVVINRLRTAIIGEVTGKKIFEDFDKKSLDKENIFPLTPGSLLGYVQGTKSKENPLNVIVYCPTDIEESEKLKKIWFQ